MTEAQRKAVIDRDLLERTLSAMERVIDVADRKTDEFDALRSCVVDLTLMLFKAAPVREPAPVPLLTNEEIGDCFDVAFKTYRHSKCQVRGQQLSAADDPDWHLAKAVEALVRQKAGL